MMNSVEMGELLALCSALDGQLVTESKIAMWLEVLDGVSYEECRDAIAPAYRELGQGVLTSKALLDAVKSARPAPQPLTYKQDEADLDESNWRSDPQPVCEEHDLRILECLDCCSLIAAQADYMRIDDRHSWAMTHVYKAKEAWA